MNKNQHGVALLLSLGLMSLLLVMVLGFATNALIERKVASSTGAITEARNIGRMALMRAMTAMYYTMRFNATNGDVGLYRFDRIVSRSTAPAANDTANDFNDTVATGFGLRKAITGSDSGNYAVKDYTDAGRTTSLPVYKFDTARPAAQMPQWCYITAGSSPARIVGRYAYMVLPDMGNIDPAAVAGGGNAATPRIGANVNEIRLSAMTDNFKAAYGTDSADLLCTGFSQPTVIQTLSSIRFSTPEALLNSVAVAEVEAWRTTTLAPYAYNMFLYGNSPSPESYHYALTNSGTLPPPAYHRFNLKRNDWDTISLEKILMKTPPAKTITDIDNSAYDSPTTVAMISFPSVLPAITATEDGQGIPHLAFLGANNLADNQKRWQIAANLKDYCDTDNKPTSNITDDWRNSAQFPLYAGNELTPRLNEFGFIVSSGIVKGEVLAGNKYKISIQPTISAVAEIVNMYDAPAIGTPVITFRDVAVTLKWGASKGNPSLTTITVPAGNFEITFPEVVNPAQASFIGAAMKLKDLETYSQTINGQTDGTDVNINLQVTSISCKHVVLSMRHGDGTTIPFTYVNANFATGPFSATSTSNIFSGGASDKGVTDVLNKNFAAAFAVACNTDPRINLPNSSWTVKNLSTSIDATSKVTLVALGFSISGEVDCGADNSVREGTVNTEQGTNNPALANAKITNLPMESLSELGNIHRAEAWKYLNIGVADGAKIGYAQGHGYSFGGGTTTPSSNGYLDGNILDQVKIGNLAVRYGLIDINTRSANLWRALLTNATGGSTFAFSDFLTGLRNHNRFFKTRADLLSIPSTPTGTTKNLLSTPGNIDDADMRTSIGNIMNIIKTEPYPEIINVLIVAQSIKDVGGDGVDLSITKRDSSGGQHTKPDNRLGQFDFAPGNIYYDEITGECKLLARIKRNADNSLKILSIEYLTE